MKSSQNRPSAASRRSEAEAALGQHISELFLRMPELAGFAIGRDFQLEEVSVYAWPGYAVGEEFHQELADGLAELADERPDAARLLPGRTFARAFH